VALSSTKAKYIVVIVVKESTWVKTKYQEPLWLENSRKF
jgi:hypothetical protein